MGIEIGITAVLCLLCGGVFGYILRNKLINKKQLSIKEFNIPPLETFNPKSRYWTVSYKRNASVFGEICTVSAPTKQVAIEEAYKILTSEIGKSRFALTGVREFVSSEENTE